MPETRTPIHLWIIGVVTLLWNAMGAFDYVMTKIQHEGYMSGFTPEQLDYFYSFPAWTVAAWAIAVWGSLIGSILLLMRSRRAVAAFVISFVAMVITSIQNFILSEVTLSDIMGPGAAIFSAVIFVVAFLLIWYARAMSRRGVLT